jgi:hypothetical protein
VQVSFQLTPEELKDARQLFYSRVHSRVVRVTPSAAIALGFVIAVAVLLNIYRHPDGSHTQGLLVACIFTSYGFVTRKRLHEFGPEPDYRDEQVLEFVPDGVGLPTLRCSISWTRFSRFIENDNMFLLVSPWPFRSNVRAGLQTKPVVIVLPKRAFSERDIQEFRDLSRQHLSIFAKKAEASQSPGQIVA